jgi:anti-sigma regulatory factor (Ser/Thr protein kinase)
MHSPFRPRCERVSRDLYLTAVPTAAGQARRFARGQLRSWQLAAPSAGDLPATAELITSELVTNAVKATGFAEMPDAAALHQLSLAAVVLRLRTAHDSLFIDVWDSVLAPPTLGNPSDLDESGRGLALVAAMAKAWDWHPCYSPWRGKVIWAAVTIPSALVSAMPPPTTEQPLPKRAPTEQTPQGEFPNDLSLLRRVRDALDGLAI